MSTAVALSLAGVVGAAVFAQVIATEPDRSRRRASGGQMGLFPDEAGTPLFAGRAVTQSVTPSVTQSPAPDVVIRHTPEGGTVIEGTTRAQADLMKRNRLRWWREGGVWYVPNTRDKRPDRYRLDQLATAFRDAGLTVEVEVDHSLRPTAEREAARADRLEERADRLEARSGRHAAESERRLGAAKQIADMIPLGQPILVGHHSERHARRDQDRIHSNMRKGVDAHREAQRLAAGAESSRTHQAYRETLPVTLRRIAKLEAEERGMVRALEGRQNPLYHGDPIDPNGAYAGRLRDQLADTSEELQHWRAHAATLEATGVKRWGPSDFKKGDIVKDRFGPHEVVRVNAKSLSVATGYSWTRTIPYDDVKGKGSG